MKRKRTIITVLIILLIALTSTAAYIYKILDLIQQSPLIDPDSGDPIGNDPDARKKALGIPDDAPSGTGVVNILLLGLDNRSKNEPGHSDAIMIASIDKVNRTIKLTSLMRDMYVSIPGKNNNRINTAYFMGGPSLAIKTINSNFKLNIEDYAIVDFFALEEIIDKVDGIPIDVKQNEIKYINQYIDELNKISRDGTWTPYIESPGLQTLTGRQAVAYSRVRYVGRDDFERTERQRRVMNELFKKAASVGVTRLPDLVTTILPNVETSMTKNEIISLGIAVLGFGKKDLEQFRIPADGTFSDEYVGKMLVLMPDLEENTRLLHEFIYE